VLTLFSSSSQMIGWEYCLQNMSNHTVSISVSGSPVRMTVV